MPTYVYPGRFWTIELDGTTVVVTYGPQGSPGKTSRYPHSSLEYATSDFETRVEDKLANGYKLEKARAAPKRAAKPRGSRSKQSTASKLGDGIKDLRGDADLSSSRIGNAVVWRDDQIVAAHLVESDDPGMVAMLERILAHPAAKVRELVLAVGSDTVVSQLAEVLAAKRPPIVSLTLGDGDSEIGNEALGELAPLWPVCANVETLFVRGSELELGDIELPALRKSRFATCSLSSAAARAISAARWAALQSLEVYIGDSRAGATCTLADLERLLARDDLEQLTHLGLVNTELGSDLCTVLPRAPVVRRLAKLSLAHGTLIDDDARTLARGQAALKHLEVLDVHDNYLSEPEELLAGCAKRIHSLGQREQWPGSRRQVAYTLWPEGEDDDDDPW